MHWGDMGWGWGAALIWMIFMLIVLAGIAAVIIFAIRQSSGPRSSSAEQILAERYARGEIDEEEYQQRRRTLRS
jgi:putative membrane protein